jgi:imidazolonepropionase
VSIDGLQDVGSDSVQAMAGSPALAVLIPGDAVSPDARAADARILINAGVAVALGSGMHHRRGSTYNMQTVVALACSRLKMSTAEAISAATVNAAYASGCAARTGSLQFGKDADLLILSISDYREMSYYLGVNQVQLAMKRGETVFQAS